MDKMSNTRAAGLSVGMKVGIAIITASVGIAGGIFIYQKSISQPKETETSNLTQEVDVTDSKKEEVIVTPTLSPTVTSTEESTEEEEFTLEGEWNRTNVNAGESGLLEITNVNQDGFDFCMNVLNGGNIGDISGYAFMDSESEATAQIDLYDGSYATFHFNIVDNQIQVTTENAEFLGGMGTYFDGIYVTGEPKYLNEGIVDETLGEYKDKVMNLLGSDYDNLTLVMENGASYETELTFSGFVRGIGVGADLWIKEDGKIYCLINEWGNCRFYTNDQQYSESLPREFDNGVNLSDIKYIYQE